MATFDEVDELSDDAEVKVAKRTVPSGSTRMFTSAHIADAFRAAIPVMLGYVGIGIPCGILSESVGMNALQVFLLSALFYSGAGQFMIPNMYLAGSPVASIVASVSFVNTRQMLYSACFAPDCKNAPKWLSFCFAASVTDETFGISTARFSEGNWSVDRALMTNMFSQTSWALSNVVGVLVGSAIDIPLPIAAFAMTSIFICLLVMQKRTSANIVAAVCAMIGVAVCKLVGLTGPAILIGALFGVIVALVFARFRDKSDSTPSRCEVAREEVEDDGALPVRERGERA